MNFKLLIAKSVFCIPFLLSYLTSSSFADENITFTSYYPSPKGVYKRLRLYPRADEADFQPGKTCITGKQKGEMVYYKDSADVNNNTVVVCGNDGKWTKIEELGNASLWALNEDDPDNKYLYPLNSQSSVAIGTDTVSFGTYMAGSPLEEKLQRAQLQVEGAISRQGSRLLGTAQDSQINLGVNIGVDESITGRSDVDIFGAAVSGGGANLALGNYATVSGGVRNRAGRNPPDPVTDFATVTGGLSNVASGQAAVVSGGELNQAIGGLSVVSGGQSNLASGLFAVVSGGQSNRANNNYAVVSGGASNTASGVFSVVSGGVGNTANGDYAVVSGGQDNQALGDYSWVGGRNMQLTPTADRTFAWGYSDNPPVPPITQNDAFIIYSDRSLFRVELGNSPQVAGKQTDLFVYNLPKNPGGPLPELRYGAGGQIFWETSSIRYKTNLRPIENALAKVKQLRGVYFNWKESGKPALGMIAEEVGAVIPEIVSYEENGKDARSLDYEKLVGLLVEAIREQDEKISQLEQRKRVLEEKAAR